MRRVAIVTGLAVILCVSLASYGGLMIDVLGGLAFGWLAYPARVLPKVTIAWDGVAMGLICLALFTIGLHRTLRWFYGEVQKAAGAAVEVHRPWSARWTASLVALVVVMFVVGMSVTAVMHQAGWLIAARRSLVEEKTQYRDDWGSSVDHLRQIGMASYMLTMKPGSPRSGQSHPDGAMLHSWMTDILPEMSIVLGGRLSKRPPLERPPEFGLLQVGGPDLSEPGGRGHPQPRGLRPGPLRRKRPRPGSGPGVVTGRAGGCVEHDPCG